MGKEMNKEQQHPHSHQETPRSERVYHQYTQRIEGGVRAPAEQMKHSRCLWWVAEKQLMMPKEQGSFEYARVVANQIRINLHFMC